MIYSSSIIAFSLCICVSRGEFDAIVGYRPLHDVRDFAVVDKDLDLVISLLKKADYASAEHVYNEGAFSRSYADLSLDEGVVNAIDAHSSVTVASEGGHAMMRGVTMEPVHIGAKTVRVLYENLETAEKCQVGGHPDPIFDGCFPSAGHIRFDTVGVSITYSYDTIENNRNDRTLAMFSTQANKKMRPCGSCDLFAEYKRFYQYYGQYDYAHQWVMSAFEQTRITFDSSVSDFTLYSLESRGKAAVKAIVTMIVYMYVVRMLEESIHQCRKATEESRNSEIALKEVDGAVAFYAGSLEHGTNDGKLLYALADMECKEFKTCGINGDSEKGTAQTNIIILDEFSAMQATVETLSCTEARSHKDNILWNMRVPLIQGTLRYAYIRADNSKSATGNDKAIGAAYAASIVPLIAACNYQDAEIIKNAMDTMKTENTEFSIVKSAFERHYACLAVKCHDIGGYWDKTKKRYHNGAEPCTFDVAEDDNSSDEKVTKRRWVISGTVIAMIVACLFFVLRRKTSRRKASRMDDDSSESSSEDSDFDNHNFRIT